ncbi:MAG: hypothetical protein KDI92_09520 [Xanthomonadales bacterium]|nr:hypothetical protein [Xanthomonadales bacterium]
MSNSAKNIFLITWIVLLLAACGGSSDGGGASPGPVITTLKITITPNVNSLPANTNEHSASENSPFVTSVNVRVTFENGNVVPDGTTVRFSTGNASIALVSTADDPTTPENELRNIGVNASAVSSGGNATFYIHSAQSEGNVTFTASAVDPQTNRTSTKNLDFNVTEGPEQFERFTMVAQAQTMPANVFNLSPEQAFRTVYNTEVEISFRDPLGNYVNPLAGGDDAVEVSINPLTVAAFSTLDDPESDDVNEIFVTLGSGPVDMAAGKAKVFVWSRDPGVATITATILDQFTGDFISAQLDINVISGGTSETPTSISMAGSGANYVNGSGGSQSQVIQAFVEASGVPVVNPEFYNNVKLDLVTDAQNSGELITGLNVNGQAVSGQSISINTVNGTASFQLLSGNNPNTAIITATADRADNNVDNGLQDPITAQNNFVISDGVLFGLEITSPNINSLFVNRVDGSVVTEDGIGNIDGSYSMTISAIGTDKGGNPALPQTIQFGLIDSPIEGFPNDVPGTFVNSGFDGDPVEGGNIFTSLSGDFINGVAEVQPNDTLLVFGEEILRNEDLESAVTIQNILSDTTVRISERFNNNDLSGSVINDMDIFPYIIGRAVDGNIDAIAVIDENGVATTQINYPVSKLGKIAGVYAKGQGATNNGVTRSVTDVEMILYPGISSIPGTELSAYISVSPAIIPANIETPVTVCVLDAALHPIQGADVQWGYVGGSGTGLIDGVSGSGIMTNRTGPDGCSTGLAFPSGIISVTDDSGYIFNVGSISCLADGDSVCIRIGNPGEIYLSATPDTFVNSGFKTIDLFLFGGNGQGISNVPLFATCEASGGTLRVEAQPDPTDENGYSELIVFAALDDFNSFNTGTCTISTGSGTPQAVVDFRGVDLCSLGISPTPIGCNNP